MSIPFGIAFGLVVLNTWTVNSLSLVCKEIRWWQNRILVSSDTHVWDKSSLGCNPSSCSWCQSQSFAIISGAQHLGHGMDKFNISLRNFVSFDLQCRIHIVTLRWSNCGSELQCWGVSYCGRKWIVSVVHTKDVSVVVPSWISVGGVVAIGDGNSIFGAMEI
jgi:hypothetical protein